MLFIYLPITHMFIHPSEPKVSHKARNDINYEKAAIEQDNFENIKSCDNSGKSR